MLQSAETGQANSFLLHKGWIGVKKGLMLTKRYAALCAPTTIADIQALYEFLFIAESNTPIPLDEKAIPWLGSIAFSAVRGTPFLVLLQSDSKTDKPEFIHLDTLGGISDEVTMGTACSFSLHLSRADIRFQTFTSTDYQDWMQALEIAYQLLHNNTQNIAVKQPVRATSQSSGPFRPTPSISRDDSEDLMKRAFAIRQSIEAAPIVSGSQFSKYQGSFENLSQRPVPPRKDSNQREE